MTTLETLSAFWQSFFFAPESAAPVVLFRMAFGLIQVISALLLWGDLKQHFSPDSAVSLETIRKQYQGQRFSLFFWLPSTMATTYTLWALLLLSAVMLAIGFCTPVAAALLFLLLVSFHHRNPCVLNSGDTLSRLMAFLLVFSAAGSQLSVDAALRPLLWGDEQEPLAAPWATRLMQLQVSIVYLRTVFWKLRGDKWRAGTAAYFPLMLQDYRRCLPPAWALSRPAIAFATWGTLVVEIAMGVLVWVREFRYPVILATFAMHLVLELLLNVQLFGWLMMATMLLFIFPEHAQQLCDWLASLVG